MQLKFRIALWMHIVASLWRLNVLLASQPRQYLCSLLQKVNKAGIEYTLQQQVRDVDSKCGRIPSQKERVIRQEEEISKANNKSDKQEEKTGWWNKLGQAEGNIINDQINWELSYGQYSKTWVYLLEWVRKTTCICDSFYVWSIHEHKIGWW